jgi:hypothetical protein
MTERSALLAAAAADPVSVDWSELFEAVCHQGVWHPDAFPLLPGLARAAAGWRPEHRETALSLAAYITVNLDEESAQLYAPTIAVLGQLAEETLAAPGGDRQERIRAVLAFEGEDD